jgi:hypothetical protein
MDSNNKIIKDLKRMNKELKSFTKNHKKWMKSHKVNLNHQNKLIRELTDKLK